MKTQHLSNFQKQQYTSYLEAQLEKFSAFILSQKKENQHHRLLQQTINNQAQQISALSNQLSLLQTYQKENFRQCQRLQSATLRNHELENRLKKVESCYFQVNTQKQNYGIFSNINEGQVVTSAQFSHFKKDVLRKMELLDKTIKGICVSQSNAEKMRNKNRESQITNTNCSDDSVSMHGVSVPTEIFVTKKELRKTEDNIYEFFDKKFNKIQKMVKKSLGAHNNEKKVSPSNSRISQKKPYKEETFGLQPNNDYNDLDIGPTKNHDQSYSASEISYQMRPVQYFSQKSISKEQKRINKNKSRSKSGRKVSKSIPSQISISKSKEKTHKRSKSKSISHSKSHKSRSPYREMSPINTSKGHMKENTGPKKVKKERHTHSRNHSPTFVDPCKMLSIKQYKKCCKKKHF